jgi:hypothetical protein
MVIPVLFVIIKNEIGEGVPVFSILDFHADVIPDCSCYLPQDAALGVHQELIVCRGLAFNGIVLESS